MGNINFFNIYLQTLFFTITTTGWVVFSTGSKGDAVAQKKDNTVVLIRIQLNKFIERY